jgi:hypothetical protein
LGFEEALAVYLREFENPHKKNEHWLKAPQRAIEFIGWINL